MTSPVWLDGPLEGQDHEVTADMIEQGMYRSGPDLDSIYTFTRVVLFDKVVVVGSVQGGIPSPDVLFRHLASPGAQRAVETRP